MKAAIIDTLRYTDDSITFSDMLEETLNKNDVSSDVVKTAALNLIPCMGCDGCLYKTPGRCIMKDDLSDVLTPISKNELLICLTEMKYGGYSSDFKLIVDKFALLATPFYQMGKGKLVHRKRYPYPKRLYVIGITEHIDQEQADIFSRIVHNNAINLNIEICGSFVFERQTFNNDSSENVVDAILKGEKL